VNSDAPEIKLVDEVLNLVRSTDVGGQRGDMAGVAMFGTYLQAYRRMSSIRFLAERGAGAEASILARSLLGMITRAIWVDHPSDPAERRSRFERWLKREIQDEIREAEGRAELGEDVSDDLEALREQLAPLQSVPPIPSDRQLIKDELQLHPHYWRVYVRGSGHVHFSLRSAVDEVREAAKRGADLPFDGANTELAREALLLSLLTYGLFIEASDLTVQHGLGPHILELVRASGIFDDTLQA
jgi:hypothetical protein